MLLTERTDFRSYFDEIISAGSVAIDTEFHCERRYHPDLYLIQIATPTREVCIDPTEFSFQDQLAEILSNDSIVKIFHAPQTDIKLLYFATGARTINIFDTQLAAAFIGSASQTAYHTLVKDHLDVRLRMMNSTMSDWSLRPLRENQLEYALADVKYLHALRDVIQAKLKKTGRLRWFNKTCESYYNNDATYKRDVSKIYLRFKDGWRLEKKQQKALYHLLKWREERASLQNRPTRNLLSDFQIMEIAKLLPATQGDLSQFRALSYNQQKKLGRDIVHTVFNALRSDEKIPVYVREKPVRYEAQRLDLLKYFLRIKCDQWKIAPEIITNSDGLKTIARHPPKTYEDFHLFDHVEGKHAKKLKQEFWALLTGNCGIGFDKKRKVTLLETQN